MRLGLIAGGVALTVLIGPVAWAQGAAAPETHAARPAAAKPAPVKRTPAPRPVPAPPPPPAQSPEDALREARQLNDAGDNAGAYAKLKALIASAGFKTLTVQQRHAAHYLMGGVAMNAQKYGEAHAAFKAATDSPAVTGMDWFARGATASAESDDADTVYSLTRLARDFPAAVILASDDTVTGALAAAERLPDGPARRFDLLEALFDAHWKAKSPATNISDAWRAQAVDLLQKNQARRAAAVAFLRVGDPYSLAAMRADKRFDALVAAYPPTFDIAAAAERELAAARLAVVAAPLNLAPLNAHARALLRLGKAKEALWVVDNALVRALPDAGESPYYDQEEIVWTLDLQARGLMATGKAEEAIAVMRRASGLRERGGPNVTQTTALAWLHLRLGRPRDALAALSGLSGGLLTSPQIIAAEASQACALQGMGDAPGVERVLADMKTRQKDGPGHYFDALLCVGNLEIAANFVLAQLNDPAARGPMLRQLQTWTPMGEATAFDKEMAARRKRLLARPEVDMAIDRVGRIDAQPVTAPLD